MSKKQFTQEEVIELLEKKRNGKSLAVFAASIGVSKQHLWNVLHKKQLPNEKVGFTRSRAYLFERIERKKDGAARAVREAEEKEAGTADGAI